MLTVRGGRRIVVCGDSITDQRWFDPLDSYTTTLYDAATPGTSSCSDGYSRPAALPGGPPAWVEVGVSGCKVDHFDTNFATLVRGNAPWLLLYELGTNDRGVTAPATFLATYRSLMTKTAATFPGMQVGLMSIWVTGEQHPATDPDAPILNALIEQVAGEFGAEYIDTRTYAYQLEATYNLPAPGTSSGQLTVDGVHATTVPTGLMPVSGRQSICTAVQSHLVFA